MSGEVAGALLGFTGSLIGGVAQENSVTKSILANKELAMYGYDQQKQMIREQNAYNSPAAQVQRYQEAGLNPNLIYGNIDPGNQSQIAKYDRPQIDPVPSPLTTMGDALRLAMEVKKQEAEINNINAQTNRYNEDTFNAAMRNAWDAYLFGKPQPGWDFTGTRKLREYDLGIQSKSLSNALAEANVEYQSLNNEEKGYTVKNLLPLAFELKQLEVQGASYDNVMKYIDSTLWRDKRIAEMSSSPFKILGTLTDGILNNGSPTSEAVKDALKHPFSLKYNPVYQTGKMIYDAFERWRERRSGTR